MPSEIERKRKIVVLFFDGLNDSDCFTTTASNPWYPISFISNSYQKVYDTQKKISFILQFFQQNQTITFIVLGGFIYNTPVH